MYAIVDIETTGNYTPRSRITEIAIFLHNGEKITDQFHTLINPESVIPPYISSMTGITHQMVENAPKFYEVAKEIFEMLNGNIFIAHNVNFDYNFIRQEYKALGGDFQAKKLCTVRLARKILPGYSSYGLGNLSRQLGISINGRHRAYGDAEATVKIFNILLKKDKEGYINKALKRNSTDHFLPPNLPKEQFDSLPEEAGVYYFHDQKGKVIYIGKAKNIKNRVKGHFTAGSETTRKQHFFREIYSLSHELCGNEFVSLLYETHEIQRLWPLYNRSQKRVSFVYGVFLYEDQLGYKRFSIGRLGKNGNALLAFKSLSDARSFLNRKVREFELCPKLAGLHSSPGPCFDHRIHVCKGACAGEEKAGSYNRRVNKAISSFASDDLSVMILGRGRNDNESSVIWIENGRYRGFGFYDSQAEIFHSSQLKDFIKPYPDNQDIQRIVQMYLNQGKDYKIVPVE